MLLIPNPKNETPQHYELKIISTYILWNLGCRYIGTEIAGCYGLPAFENKYNKNHFRTIIDALGIKMAKGKIYSYGMEAKISVSDYKSGFCTGVNALYIIAPKGVITKDMIPQDVGLIEVDLDNYTIKEGKKRFILSGIEIIKKAKMQFGKWYPDELQNKKLIDSINRSLTIDNIFRRQKIKIGERVKK